MLSAVDRFAIALDAEVRVGIAAWKKTISKKVEVEVRRGWFGKVGGNRGKSFVTREVGLEYFRAA